MPEPHPETLGALPGAGVLLAATGDFAGPYGNYPNSIPPTPEGKDPLRGADHPWKWAWWEMGVVNAAMEAALRSELN